MGEAGKNCLFPNRPPNLSGLGVMGHLHGEPSEAAAATAGLRLGPPKSAELSLTSHQTR